MSAAARSSASRPPSARAPWPSAWSTTPGTPPRVTATSSPEDKGHGLSDHPARSQADATPGGGGGGQRWAVGADACARLDRLQAEGIPSPRDPGIVAARIKASHRRPRRWDLNLSMVRDDLDDAAVAVLEHQFLGLGSRLAAAAQPCADGRSDGCNRRTSLPPAARLWITGPTGCSSCTSHRNGGTGAPTGRSGCTPGRATGEHAGCRMPSHCSFLFGPLFRPQRGWCLAARSGPSRSQVAAKPPR